VLAHISAFHKKCTIKHPFHTMAIVRIISIQYLMREVSQQPGDRRKRDQRRNCGGGNQDRRVVCSPVLWNRNYFLQFRFRFLLFKSFGSGSGSDFWKSYGSGSGSYFWKVTVPVPVPVPALYLDHKKQIFQEYFWNVFCLFTGNLFYKEKVYKLKCEWKIF
jgi:hypothetical protein